MAELEHFYVDILKQRKSKFAWNIKHWMSTCNYYRQWHLATSANLQRVQTAPTHNINLSRETPQWMSNKNLLLQMGHTTTSPLRRFHHQDVCPKAYFHLSKTGFNPDINSVMQRYYSCYVTNLSAVSDWVISSDVKKVLAIPQTQLRCNCCLKNLEAANYSKVWTWLTGGNWVLLPPTS